MKQVQEWKDQAVQHWIEDIIKVAEEKALIIEEHGRHAFISNKDGVASKWLEYPTVYRQFSYKVHNGELGEYTINELRKMIDARFKTLQAKVEKKIGTILEIDHIGGDDYRFKGELGYCSVEVIGAGGYNVQCWHTRWIIKK